MASSPFTAVILAGGSGTRLWPLSRQMAPKQFMSLDGSASMLMATAQRLNPMIEKNDIWVVTGRDSATGAGYRDLQQFNHLIEPAARNTAPAIGIMAAYLTDFANNPVMLVLPADHVITDTPAFHKAISIAVDTAEHGKLVTFGITPTRPETGYGYIKAKGTDSVLSVERFVEKPDSATAQNYLNEGGYYWNSGMFVAKASVMLAEIEKCAPELFAGLTKIRQAWQDGGDWRAAVAAHFAELPGDSLDYAVMEKSDNVALVPCDIGWSDVGSWDAVLDIADKDDHGNAVKAPAISIDTRNTLVMGDGGRVIATIGVEDLCIVDTPDALLVSHKSQAQKVKNVVDELKKRGGDTHVIHRTAHRPWGSYTVLADNVSGYKIKRIEVVPGGRLSLQSHQHRSEHWVVVSGTATVTNGDNVLTLLPGQSTYIPLGHKHRLENLGKIPVQIVEVQVGEYLGEDDIVRYDDVYGRQ